MDKLLVFLFMRQLIFIAELFLSEGFFFVHEKRRSKFVLRALLSGVILLAVSFLSAYLFYYLYKNTDFSDNKTLKNTFQILFAFGQYFVMFMATVGCIALLFHVNVYRLFSIGVLGYCIQHFVFDCYLLLFNVLGVNYILLRYEMMTWINALYYIGFDLVFYVGLAFVIRNAYKKGFDVADNGALTIIMFAVVLVINVGIGTLSEHFSQEHFGLYMTSMAVQALSLGIIVLMEFMLTAQLKLRQENQIISNMLDQQQRQFKFAEVNAEALSIKAHDLKHQVAILRAGGEEAKKLLDDLEQTTRNYSSVAKTDNSTINIILSEKWAYCNKNDIRLTSSVNPNVLSFMDKLDIYSLFNNILDNAIEAVESCPSAQRVISFSVSEKSGMVCILAQNYYLGEIKLKNGLPVTNKKDKINHGFGMRSIQKIVGKYEGEMNISALDGVYKLSITFIQ